VFVRVGDGVPPVFITAGRAKSLGEQLIRDADAAKSLPPD
jgi:hypothetical protein